MKGEVHVRMHVAVGILLSAIIYLSPLGIPWYTIPMGFVMFIGVAKLPDIDHKIPFVSHRGLSHTFFVAGLFGFVVYILSDYIGTHQALPAYMPHFLGVTAGVSYALHIIEDIFTVGGGFSAAPLWPLSSEKISLTPFRHDSLVFTVFSWVLLFGAVLTVLHLFGVINVVEVARAIV